MAQSHLWVNANALRTSDTPPWGVKAPPLISVQQGEIQKGEEKAEEPIPKTQKNTFSYALKKET